MLTLVEGGGSLQCHRVVDVLRPSDVPSPLMGPRPTVDELDQRLFTASIERRLFGRAEPVLLGRYRIEAEVGRGGGGRVYRAQDPRLSRTVAIKVFRGATRTDAGRSRLRREAEALARLSHPQVVDVFDVFDTPDEGLAVVMEWVEGPNLERWLTERARPAERVVALFVSLGRALADVHRAGWVHRDIKPSNVLVGRDGRVRLADFGLARLWSADASAEPPHDPPPGGPDPRITAPGTTPGTPAYMAPETRRGREPDARADQYSFCVSLFEALHGRLPDGSVEVAPEAMDRELPSTVRRTLARGLAEDPRRRFDSMDALVASLDPSIAPRRRYAVASVALGLAALVTWIAPTVATESREVTMARAFEGPRPTVRDRSVQASLALGHVRLAEGDFSPAIAIFDEVIARTEQRPEFVEAEQDARASRGAALASSGRLPEGVAELERAYDLAIEHHLDQAAAEVATNLTFATGYSMANRPLGLAWARHAQAILDRIGADGEAQAKLDGHLGSVEALAGNYVQAERLHRRAEAIRRAGGKPLLPKLASSLNNLGNVYLMQGDLEQAERCHAEALELRRAVFGRRHRQVSISLNNLASVDLHRGDVAAAEQRLREAAEVMEAVAGPENRDLVHPLQNLATLTAERGALAESEAYARRARAIAEQGYDADDPRIAAARQILGRTLHLQGRDDEAFVELFAALRIARGTLGDDHDDVASIRHAIGGVFLTAERHAEARPYLEAAHARWMATLGPTHRNTAANALRLAKARRGTGDPEGARTVIGTIVDGGGLESVPRPDRAELLFELTGAEFEDRNVRPDRRQATRRLTRALALLDRDQLEQRRLAETIERWAHEHGVRLARADR